MKPLLKATIIGTIAQLAMVAVGHTNPAVAKMFAVGGMSISFIAGALYAIFAGYEPRMRSVTNGALAGGLCAIIGIGVSCALGDVTPIILLIGTFSSAVTGALGGLAGRFMSRRGTQPLAG